MLFGLDGRVLRVQTLPDIPDASYETLSGARISATCATNVAGDSRGEATVTRPWPADQTSLGFRFARDVAGWCRLEDQSGSAVAFVSFPGVPPGAREQIAETANGWARQFASSAQACNDYYTGTGPTACEPECGPSKRHAPTRAGSRSSASTDHHRPGSTRPGDPARSNPRTNCVTAGVQAAGCLAAALALDASGGRSTRRSPQRCQSALLRGVAFACPSAGVACARVDG